EQPARPSDPEEAGGDRRVHRPARREVRKGDADDSLSSLRRWPGSVIISTSDRGGEMIAIVRRIALIAAAALLLPACGEDFKSGSTLFTERFNGTFPGTSWSTPVVT